MLLLVESFLAAGAMAQMPIQFPFTADELYLGLVLVAPEVEARQLASDILAANRSQGWGLSYETLILMSLASPELSEKVERFREAFGLTHSAEWSEKHEQLRRYLIGQGKIPRD